MTKGNTIDPFMKALKAVNQISQGKEHLSEDDLKKQRTSMELASKLATPPIGVSSERFTIGTIHAEWHRPDFVHNAKHVILYCHGGGYTCGGLGYAGILASKLAIHTGLEVLSFEYRLAPEHPYPAAFEDTVSMWDYMMQKGYGASSVILAGDSAGGNLALTLTQHLKEAGRFLPKALLLFSPWTDMTAIAKSYQTHKEDDPILSYDYIISTRNAYVSPSEDLSQPKYSPLYGDFSGFPPTLIQVGRNEILLDDSKLLASKMEKTDCFVRLEIFEKGWHVFQQMPIPIAAKAMKSVGDFVTEVLY